MGGRKRALSASLPWCAIASTAPRVSIWHRLNAMLDDFHISSTAVDSSVGMPWPPYSGAAGMPFQPVSQKLA